MARRIAIIIILLFTPAVSKAQFIDAGFGTGPFGKKQFYTGLFGTGNSNNSGGCPANAMTFNGNCMTFNGQFMTFVGNP